MPDEHRDGDLGTCPSGAKPTNHELSLFSGSVCAVPVLPATEIPGIFAFLPVPLSTTLVIICVSWPATAVDIGRLITDGSVWSRR